MAFNPAYGENLSQSMGMATSTKASGKRRRKPFSLKSRKRFDPPLFIPRSQLPKKLRSTSYAEVANPYRDMAMKDNPSAPPTTSRNNDGMSYVW